MAGGRGARRSHCQNVRRGPYRWLRGRPGGDARAMNRASDLDAQLDRDAKASGLGQGEAPAVQ